MRKEGTENRPVIMGILNLTPDSFSDGLPGAETATFLAKAERLIAEGADILDIGGESTRPGAAEVPADEEIARVRPFLEAFRASHPDFPISLDTRKIRVYRALADFGIAMVNDTSCLADPDLAAAARDRGASYVLMHSRGTPATMTTLTRYAGDVTDAIFAELEERLVRLQGLRFPADKLILDPGFGFAKAPDQCRSMMSDLARWPEFARRISAERPPRLLFAVSRKRFLQTYTGENAPIERDDISAELARQAARAGFHIMRTHNVALTRRTLCG